MERRVEERPQSFGSDWTSDKLQILRAYLDAYTTAMKNQPFTLIYVDAFAGSGAIEIRDDEEGSRLLAGSPVQAVQVDDKPFDQLVFVEVNERKSDSLRRTLAALDAADRATIMTDDANSYLPKFCADLGPYDRAVVFLDPFGAQVDWSTVAALAATEKCDTWILFSIGVIRRSLARRGDPSSADRNRLTRVFGSESWRELQHPPVQPSMFDDADAVETDRGVDGLIALYRRQLEEVFADVAPGSRPLLNSKNVRLYEFMFAAANRAGAPIAVRIANHLLTRL